MPTVHLFHGRSAAYLGTLADWESIELSVTMRGPDTGQISIPVPAIKSQKHLIRTDRIGAYIVVDGRDQDVLEPWFGRIEHCPGSSTSPTGALQLRGPASWLELATVAAHQTESTNAFDILRDVVVGHPVDLRLEMGAFQYKGAVGPANLMGQTVGGFMDQLESERGVRVRLRVPEAQPMAKVEISDPGSPLDLTGSVCLREGHNSEWDFEHHLVASTAELVGVADSLTRPGGVVSAGVRAPAGNVLGLAAAYSAVLESAVARQLAGQGQALIAPEIPTMALLEAALDAKLRDGLPLPTYTQVKVTDTALWPKLWPGRLVSARCTSDPMGDYDNSIALIEQITFGLGDSLACNCALALWDVESF